VRRGVGPVPLLLLPAVLGAQAPARRGRVVDSTTAAIPGARVAALRGGAATVTDDGGEFTITAGPGDTLLIRAFGYRPDRVPVPRDGRALTVTLRPLPIVLPGVVVTASRRPQAAGETAVQVTSISAAEIAAAAAASVDRVVTQLPGVQSLPTEPTGVDLSIRGLDGPRVLVLVDGEPISGDLLENRDLSRLSTIAVDHVEVVKGPLSALYGSDALGGVVNVITAPPAGPLSLGVDGRIGDFGRREASVTAQSGGPVAYRVSGGWREENDVASISQPTDALDRVWDFRGSVRGSPAPSLDLRADLSLLRERQRWQLSADGFNGFNDNTGITGWGEAAWHAGAATWRGRLYAEHYDHLFREAQADDPLASDTTPAQREDLVRGSLAWDTRTGAHALGAGLDVTSRSIVAPGKVDGAIGDREVEGYGQDSWELGSLLVTPTARVTWDSRWGSALTPSLAGAWLALPTLRFRAGVGRGFRGPSFKELAWDFANPAAGYIIRGNPAVVPERSWQSSAGLTWAFARGFTADLEGYRNDVRDLIELVAVGTDSATSLLEYSPRNVSRARTQGVELETRWEHGGWSGTLGYSYLDARDLSTGAWLDRRAANSGRVGLGRDAGVVQADLTLVYTGSAPALQPSGAEGRQDAFLATNVQARLRLGGGLELAAGADDLFDQVPSGWTARLGRRLYLSLETLWHPR